MMIAKRATALVAAIVVTSVPAIAQAPDFALRRNAVVIDLTSPQTVVVLGISWNADVMLLYPHEAFGEIVGPGRHALTLDFAGQWLAGGQPRQIAVSSPGPSAVCIGPGEMTAAVSTMRTGTYPVYRCGWTAGTGSTTVRWPMLRHLVVLTSEPGTSPVALDALLEKWKVPNRSADVAADVAARLNQRDTTRAWNARGRSIKRQTSAP